VGRGKRAGGKGGPAHTSGLSRRRGSGLRLGGLFPDKVEAIKGRETPGRYNYTGEGVGGLGRQLSREKKHRNGNRGKKRVRPAGGKGKQ